METGEDACLCRVRCKGLCETSGRCTEHLEDVVDQRGERVVECATLCYGDRCGSHEADFDIVEERDVKVEPLFDVDHGYQAILGVDSICALQNRSLGLSTTGAFPQGSRAHHSGDARPVLLSAFLPRRVSCCNDKESRSDQGRDFGCKNNRGFKRNSWKTQEHFSGVRGCSIRRLTAISTRYHYFLTYPC